MDFRSTPNDMAPLRSVTDTLEARKSPKKQIQPLYWELQYLPISLFEIYNFFQVTMGGTSMTL